MKTRHIGSVLILLCLLSACAPALTSTPISLVATALPAVAVEATAPTPVSFLFVSTDPLPAATAISDPVGYQPVSMEVCQNVRDQAVQSLGLIFSMQISTPFLDYATGQTGRACSLTTNTSGASISDPYAALTTLVDRFADWTELPDVYGAGGPTGAATGMWRDAALMLISVSWVASADANCPTQQPIGTCPLTAEQKLYTVKIEIAQK